MIDVWKTLNYKIDEITPSYTQYSKKIKACGLTRETIILQLRDPFLNTTRMLNILRTKFKYNIATHNFNEHKYHTKQSPLSYS